MGHFISCDWGTSSFRLRLMDAASKQIIATVNSLEGIAATYSLWKNAPSTDRIPFYTAVILRHIELLEKQTGQSLENLTVIISGMASASIGMIDLPYQPVPYQPDKNDLVLKIISPVDSFEHTIVLVSGLCTANDVMRGEETILAGCDIKKLPGEQLLIFPGTHSKHVVVENGIVKDFKTYMTGELFDLLANKSILAASVQANEFQSKIAFANGVGAALSNNILNNIFHVRTNQLFSKLTKQENYLYLSGLLLGEELKNCLNKSYKAITIVSSGPMATLYIEAITTIGLNIPCNLQSDDEALVNGQAIIYQQFQSIK